MTLTFSYAALDVRGALRRGSIAAPSRDEAIQLLRAEGLSAVRVRPAAHALIGAHARLSSAQLSELMLLLAQLLGAGSNVTTALGMLRAQQQRGRVTSVIEAVQRRIASGDSVADAFAHALRGQDGSVSALIAAGEMSGDLPGVLRTAATQIERDQALRAAFWSAISYPLFILVATMIALIIILGVVVPSLEPLVADASARPGASIRLLLGVSELLRRSWPWLAAVLAGSVVGGMALWRAGILGPLVERALLDGVLRGLTRCLVFGRTAAVLGRLLSAGIPASQALRLAAAAVPMNLARTRLEAAGAAIYEGAPMSRALQACKGMPPIVLRMAEVGEQSGSLGALLERAGDFEQAAALRDIQGIAKWLGPVLIVVLGGMIGTVMASLLGAISGIGSAVLS